MDLHVCALEQMPWYDGHRRPSSPLFPRWIASRREGPSDALSPSSKNAPSGDARSH